MKKLLLTTATAGALGVFGARQEPVASPELIADEYRAFAELEMRKGFQRSVHREPNEAELREALWLFEQRALELPAAVARELGEREQRNLEARADLETGGPLALLANLATGGGGPFEDFVASREALGALFVRKHEPKQVAASTSDEVRAALADGAAIHLPAGVFAFGNLLDVEPAFPREVSLSGLGRDATLIVFDAPLAARGPLEDFRLARCTVLVRGKQLFEQAHAATVELDDVRVIGFDNGVQSGALLEFRGGVALSARSCAFLGGYGALPGGAILLEAPDTALLAHFEACEFDLHSIGLARLKRGVSLKFLDCTFSRIFDSPRDETENWRGVTFEGGSLQRIPASARPKAPRKVDELFPGWDAR
jgi:hypothetical protein